MCLYCSEARVAASYAIGYLYGFQHAPTKTSPLETPSIRDLILEIQKQVAEIRSFLPRTEPESIWKTPVKVVTTEMLERFLTTVMSTLSKQQQATAELLKQVSDLKTQVEDALVCPVRRTKGRASRKGSVKATSRAARARGTR